MADKIQVAVRVRPVLFQKKDVEIHWSWSEGVVFQCEPGTSKRIGNPYLFDQVFGTETQNYQIFTKLVQPLIDSAMNGFNVTVLAYGQTASGKTYTMMGSQKELGIVQLAVDRIFSLIEQYPERAFLLRCSYIEIYNETISDLLSSNPQKLKVQELAEGHVVVHNLIETNVNTPDAVLKLMQQGNKQRKVGGTSMNERSSRSHTIFRIIVESLPRDEADRSDAAVIVSHINLVDLSGSEKAFQTNATGDRFREGCAINTSLSALSLVIKQLSEGEGFVNFRDSKLTHILRASLGGNARTAIISNVTPTVLDETSSTLKFACSAKAVQNQPQVNEVLSDQALLRKYNNYIKDLEKKLKEKELEKKPEAIEEMRRLLQEKDMKINELKEQLVVSSDVVSGRAESSLTSAQRSLRRMTWGGNRLKQELNLLGPAIFEVNTPPVPCSEKVSRTVAQVFASRQRTSNTRRSETLDEVAPELEDLDSEIFLPAEMVFSKDHNPIAKVDVATMTDVRESPFKQPAVPSTPVPVLREQLQRMRMSLFNKEQESETLREELEDLKNFTRLEQDIGVHALATAKSVDSPESADKLHRALQTANDMEVLYLDTHRKLSELKTEFQTKEAEHESEIHAMQTNHKLQIETELTEKKRLAKELADLKDKFERLEKDHSEADTYLLVISERHAKREADLRETLQEAWGQLELLGQDPNAIKENYNAKQKLTQVEQELLEMQKFNSDAQSRIASLTEELRQFKEFAVPVPEASVKGDDDRHNSSLTGMCMADELRDVFMNQDCSFAPRSINRTRKRPSSILSVALAKMDQSVCMLDSTEHEMEPSKKTRLSIQSDVSEELDISEVKEIREYLVELQSVLVRYEADYEILSQEKEQLNSQLLNAQTEIESLREEKNKVEPVGRLQDEENFAKKSDTSEEMLDSSCFVGEPSISTSVIDMEQSCESDDQFLSLRDQFTDTRGSSISTEISEAAAQRKEKVEHSNKIKQLEEELVQLNERLELLQQDVEEKTSALEEKQRSIEAAQSTIEVLEQRDGERQNLLSILDKLNEKMRLLSEDSTLVTKELETTRQTLEEIRAEARELFVAKELLESRLEKANEDLEAARAVLLDSADRVAPPSQVDQEANVRYEKTLEDLNLAHDRVKALESELELKTTELNAALNAIQQARSKEDELEESYVEKNQLEELVEKLTSQLDSLQDDLDLKIQELNEVQGAKQEVLLRNEVLDADVEQKKLEINQAQAELVEVRLKLEATGAELERAKQDLLESCARTEELVRLNEQLEREKKDAVASKETIEEELRINADAALEKARLSMDAVHRNDSEVHALQDSLDKTRAQAQHLQSSNEELLSELNLAKTEIDDLYNDLQSANAALSALNEEAASRNQDYSAELDSRTQAIQQLEVTLKETKLQLTELQSMQEVVQTELNESKRRILDLEENLESECDVRVAVQRAAAEAASVAAVALHANVEEKKKIDRELLEYRERVARLTLELSHSTSALESAKAEVLQLENTSRTERVPREELHALTSELKEALQRVFQLEESLEEKSTQLNVSYQKLEAAQARIRALEQNEVAVSNQAESFECTIKDLSAKNMNLNEMVAQFQSDLQSKEDELINLRSMTQNITLLESRLQDVGGETAQMSRIIDDKTEEILRLEGELARLHERQRELDEIRISLQSMQSVNDDLVAKLSDKENLNVDLRKNLENSTQRFDLLHSKLESVQSEKSSLSERVLLLESQLECQEAKNVNLNQMVAQFQSDIQLKEAELINLRSMTQEIALLESRLKDVGGETAQMSRIIDGKTDEIARLEEELARATESQRNHQTQLQHADQRFQERQRELDEIRISLQSMQSLNDDLVAKLSEKENLNGDLRKNLENGTQRFELLHSKLELVQSEKSSLAERVRLLESQLECQEQEIGDLRQGLSEVHNERGLSTQLKHRLNSLQAQYDDAVSQCQQLRLARDEILTHQEQSREEILRLGSKLQVIAEEKLSLEQYRILSESQKEAILQDYQTVKNALTEKENELHIAQRQRDELSNQVRMLNDQMAEVRTKANALESSSKFQVQRQLEETVDKLKRELVETRSKNEIIHLNFETEEDHRKKKIERLEKELETVKQQYVKCKEQLRLLRDRQNEDGTVSLPKPRLSIVVESISIQTDPIADKGFGFRWQMDQYVSDNERLRKKVSEIGERMEFYKEKLIKYRNLYFQTTGQDPHGRLSSSSSNHSSQPMERYSSTSSNSSNCRENVADCPNVDLERNPTRKTLAASAVPASISSQPVTALQAAHQEEAKARISTGVAKPAMTASSSTRWSGGKKESLTKEEMEKINNCNPS